MNFKKTTLYFLLCGIGIIAGAQSTWRSDLPIKPGRGVTVAGTVECDGKPLAGVTVSDGYTVTKTDRKGAYYIKSEKKNPQVFVSVPSGYEAYRDDVMPQFWADFTAAPDKFERLDFRLVRNENDRHGLIVITDMHLANQRNDVGRFSTVYMDRLRNEVKQLEDKGLTPYTIHLGDGTWDVRWFENEFPIVRLREVLNEVDFPTPFFNLMGNHDNDPSAVAGPDCDLNAARPYMKVFGPRYYSFNLGKAHYVVLDNMYYINDPLHEPSSRKGVAGKRNYSEKFTDEQLEWLQKDLAGLPADMPLIIAVHGPVFATKGTSTDASIRTEKESTGRLLEILEPFENVHFLSGHSHKQMTRRLPGEKVRADHNIAGVCGSWWWNSAFGGRNLCPDGNPVGYEVFEFDGPDFIWRHETFEEEPGRQFMAFDLNRVKEYFAGNAELRVFRAHYPKWSDYSEQPDNSIYINIWAYDPVGTLKVTENGKELEVEPVVMQNPLYDATFMVQKSVWEEEFPKNYAKPRKFFAFRAVASAPDTPVEISWTDACGKEYRQTMERPQAFSTDKY